MPRSKTAYAWKEGDRFFASLQPREANAAKNAYASASDVLRDTSARGLRIEWESIAEIDVK